MENYNKLWFLKFIFQDWSANKGNSKGKVVLFLFRLANFCVKRRIYFYFGLPYLLFYKIFVEWFLGIEIPWSTRIGQNCILYHGQALVINRQTIIGKNCIIRHCTTIGNRQLNNGQMSGCPIIADNVDIGSNVCIIGEIQISDNVKIGSGAVVVKNVPPNCTVVGNPATIIKAAN